VSESRTHAIIGAGQAGGWAAEAMRAQGFAGRVILIGNEGHPPYERPPLSKNLLLGKADAKSTYLFKSAGDQAERRILHLNNPVVAISNSPRSLRLLGGETIPFDKLLFATGGQARRLGIPGAELVGVHYLRDLADAAALRAALREATQIVVVGGGFLGLEVAAVGRQLEKRVTVVETERSVLSRALPPALGDIVAQFHRSRGTEFMLGTSLESIEGQNGRVSAVVCNGGVTLPSDLVIVSIGIVPNDSLAREIGVRTENGILVNEYGETNLPDVYAAGDVANHFNPILGRRLRLESWQNAQNQAIAVAKVMCGERSPHAELPWFWSDQFDLNIQLLGSPLDWDEICFRGDPASFKFSAFYLKDGKVVAAATFNKGNEIGGARQLIARGIAISADKLIDPTVDIRKMARGL
jgi:3-phenylpropionate/trans-cinnamate dioxygenase ferredoxin reductase component